MAGIWKRNDEVFGGASVSLGASETNTVVSKHFLLTPEAALSALRVDIVASSVTASAGITAKVQQRVADSWVDVTGLSVAITTAGTVTILMNGRDSTAGVFAVLPLSNTARVVVSTGAGDAVSIDNVFVTMER